MLLKRPALFLIIALTVLPSVVLSRAQPSATLKGLDKVTSRIHTLEVLVGETVRFGTLDITVRHSDQTPDTSAPETSVFLEIKERKDGKDVLLFSSWMFASSPGVSALEHPVYDVWVAPRQKN